MRIEKNAVKFPTVNIYVYICMYVCMYILERERVCLNVHGAERQRENLKQFPHSAWSPMPGLTPCPWDNDLS